MNIKEPNKNVVVAQSRLQRKYYHHKALIILSFLILFDVSTAWLSNQQRNGINDNEAVNSLTCSNMICTSKECLRTAMSFLQNMDERVDPCDNFYKFTCGNWAKHHVSQNLEQSFGLLDEKSTEILRFIRRFLRSRESPTEPKIIQQSRILYQSCMKADEWNAHQRLDNLHLFHMSKYPTIIVDAVTNLTGKMIANKTISEETAENVLKKVKMPSAEYKFDWIDVIAEITRVNGTDVFFRFEISPDSTKRNRIFFGAPETFGETDRNKIIHDMKRVIHFAFKRNEFKEFRKQFYPFIGKFADKIVQTRRSLQELVDKAIFVDKYMEEESDSEYADEDENVTESHEYVTDASTDEYVTDASTNEYVTDASTNEYVTDASTDEYVTDASTDEYVTDASTDEYVTDASTDEYVTDASTDEYVTDASTNEYVTDASMDEYVTDASTDEYVTDASTDEYVTDASTDENSTESDEEKSDDGDIDYYSLIIDEFENATYDYVMERLPTAFNETPQIFRQYFTTIFKEVDPPIDIGQHEIQSSRADFFYVQYLVDYILSTPTTDIELYVWWTIVEKLIPIKINQKLNVDYDLDGITLRSRSCINVVRDTMSRVVDYALAQTSFFNVTKPKVETMLNNIRTAFDDSAQKIEWIDDETRLSILSKSHAMKTLVGYPEWVLEDGKLDEHYGDLKLDKSNFLTNLIKLQNLKVNRKLKKLNYTEIMEWDKIQPSEVNAVYSSVNNAMTITLAILQYPFYDLGLEALNYGATGFTIGHELTHGFDDSGRLYDENGIEVQTWTDETLEEYTNRTECFVKQFNSFFKGINKHVNGKLKLDDNIADNGGLHQAYYAYKAYVENEGKEKLLPGFERFSHEQLFFISYGNTECKTQTLISLWYQIKYDEHSPSIFRINAVLQNSHEFAKVFNCSANSKMVSKDPCRIW